jgi:2-methylcitrate synthase
VGTQTSGLQDVIAGETSICTVGAEGHDLKYRGYDVQDLSKHCEFEEVAYLLIFGNLPTTSQLKEFQYALEKHSGLSSELTSALKNLPENTHPMDVLRTGVSILGCEHEGEAEMDSAYRLLSTLPIMMLTWYNHHFQNGKKVEFNETTIAGKFLEGLTGKKPLLEDRQAMDCSLVLYAEHEFNASTFAARVTTSTGSDIYSALCTAIGTLKGPLHGGANEKTMEMLVTFNSPQEGVAHINKMLEQKQKIMGFGHRVYKVSDPRSDVIKARAQHIADRENDQKYMEISKEIERTMWASKKLFPNADFYSATFYYLLGIPIPLYTPIFVFSRTAGWVAHILEQRKNNRLIRPRAEYTGPTPQKFKPIQERTPS